MSRSVPTNPAPVVCGWTAAAGLEERTWTVALRVVPPEWWSSLRITAGYEARGVDARVVRRAVRDYSHPM